MGWRQLLLFPRFPQFLRFVHDPFLTACETLVFEESVNFCGSFMTEAAFLGPPVGTTSERLLDQTILPQP